MRNNLKSRLPIYAASFALAMFGLGIQGKADVMPQDTSQKTTVQAEVKTDSSSAAGTVHDSKADDSISYKDADNNQVKSTDDSSSDQNNSSSDNSSDSNDSSSSDSNNSSDTSTDSSDSKADAGTVTDQKGSTTSSDTSAKDTSTKQEDRVSKDPASTDSNNDVDSGTDTTDDDTKSTGKTSNSTKAPVSQAMIGIGKQGTTTEGSTVDDVLKTIIDGVLPNDQPDSGKTGSTATPQSSSSVAVAPSSGTSPASTNPSQFPVNKQSKIKKPVTSKDLAKANFAEVVVESDGSSKTKSKTKLVTFDRFSKSFYKTLSNKKVNAGRLTPINGDKVTITTPVSHVKYLMHDKTSFYDMWPIIATVAVIRLAGLSFFVFDPLKFLFK